MPTEVYAAVPGAPWLAVSNMGTVLSERKGWRPVGFYDKRGYRLVSISGKHVFIHRIVAMAFLGPQPADKPLVRHLNGRPNDNRAANLAWGDGVENMDDARRHGTLRQGPTHHNWKEACIRGHELKGDNVYVTGGRRRCRQCDRIFWGRYRKKRKKTLA